MQILNPLLQSPIEPQERELGGQRRGGKREEKNLIERITALRSSIAACRDAFVLNRFIEQ
jgi:hypothetical protein